MLAGRRRHAAGEEPSATEAPVAADAAAQQPVAGIAQAEEPTAGETPATAPKRFREEVEVVGRAPAEAQAPSELPVRPLDVMAVAGAGENVFRTLQTLPGIAATTEFDSRIAVRGGSPDQNLTVMDGVEIHNPYRLFGLTSAFNPETVSGFELYAGGLLGQVRRPAVVPAGGREPSRRRRGGFRARPR